MIPLPAYIDPEAWAGFVEMRKASGRTRPFTPRAAVLILFELQRLKDAGHDPNASLDQSTRMGWADVYPPKDKDMARKGAALESELSEAKRREREALEAQRTPEGAANGRAIIDACRAGLRVVTK